MNFARDDLTEPTPTRRPPRTTTVLALLTTASATFSYLGAYAATDALVRAGVLPAWAPGADPRPRWMVTGFAALMGLCLSACAAFRLVGRRRESDGVME